MYLRVRLPNAQSVNQPEIREEREKKQRAHKTDAFIQDSHGKAEGQSDEIGKKVPAKDVSQLKCRAGTTSRKMENREEKETDQIVNHGKNQGLAGTVKQETSRQVVDHQRSGLASRLGGQGY